MHRIKLEQMNIKLPLLKLETTLLFTMGMVIFLSKPAIYLVSLLLLGLTTIRLLTDPEYRHTVFANRMFWASTALFVFGVVAAAIGSSYPEDIGWMAKKTMLLPMVVPFLIAFAEQKNRTAGLLGVLVGFWIAFVLTGNMHNWHWSGGRYEGATWDVGMWGVLCALLMVFSTPFIFNKHYSSSFRFLLALTFICAFVMLVTSGSRGPMLGAFSGILIYMLFNQRTALLTVFVASIVIFFLGSKVWPTQFESFHQRATSVTNTETDASNYIRLALWETGFAQIKSQLLDGDKRFWLGNGHDGHIKVSTEFYKNFSTYANIKPGLLLDLNQEKIIGDFHNMFIQAIIVTGAVWFVASILLLSFLSLKPFKTTENQIISWAPLAIIICYFVTGLTYAILPHFAFFIIIFLTTQSR